MKLLKKLFDVAWRDWKRKSDGKVFCLNSCFSGSARNISCENDSSKAIEFVRTMMKKFDLVANNPKMGVAKDAYIFGLRLFPFKNYNIFYFQTDDGVEIYRVLHSSRDTVQVFNDAIDEL